jgi:hypothetical protein
MIAIPGKSIDYEGQLVKEFLRQVKTNENDTLLASLVVPDKGSDDSHRHGLMTVY